MEVDLMKKRISKTNKKPLPSQLEYLQEDLEDLQFYLEEFSTFLPLPVVSINPLGFILDINKAFEELIGLGKIEVLGVSVEKFFVEKEKFKRLQNQVLESKKPKAQEMILQGKSKEVPVNVYLAPRKDKEGNVIGYFIGIYDITEFKALQQNLEERVKERTKELQEKLEELEKFRKLTEGRELKMVELKEKIRKLEEKAKVEH